MERKMDSSPRVHKPSKLSKEIIIDVTDVHVKCSNHGQSDPRDWRVLERIIRPEAKIKGFVRTAYGYGPPGQEDHDFISMETSEGQFVKCMFYRVIPTLALLSVVYVSVKLPLVFIFPGMCALIYLYCRCCCRRRFRRACGCV